MPSRLSYQPNKKLILTITEVPNSKSSNITMKAESVEYGKMLTRLAVILLTVSGCYNLDGISLQYDESTTTRLIRQRCVYLTLCFS